MLISDQKSFESISQDGKLRKRDIGTTTKYAPPEYHAASGNDMLDAEKFMSYQIGLALYDYLVLPGAPNALKEKAWSEKALDFDKPIFKTQIGQRMQKLIEATTNPDPIERLGLAEASSQLQQIQTLVNDQAIIINERLGAFDEDIVKENISQNIILQETMQPENNKISSDKNQETIDILRKILHYSHATLYNPDSRSHRYTVQPTRSMKNEYQLLEGDALKTAILLDFKLLLDNVDNKSDLTSVIDKFKTSDEYQTITEGQGRYTRAFGKTSSLKAFEKICDEAKKRVDLNIDLDESSNKMNKI